MAKTECVVYWPDTHIPDHDQAAVSCAIQAVEHLKPDTVVILGDFIDAGPFSAHPRKSLLERGCYSFREEELQPAADMIDLLLTYAKRIVYVEGNHEVRIESRATESGVMRSVYDLVSPKAYLTKGRSRQLTWVGYHTDKYYQIAPGLIVCHGLSVAKHAADQHLQRMPGYSVIYGHTHRRQMDSTRNPVTGQVIEAMSPGCLATLQPIYMHKAPSRHTHGLGVGYVNRRTGMHQTYMVKIDRGKCVLPDGREVRA